MKYFHVFLIIITVNLISACNNTGYGSHSKEVKTYIETNHGITIVALHGYCIDPQTYRRSKIGEHVVFGNCAVLGRNSFLPQPQKIALLVASVSPPTNLEFKSQIKQLDKLFRTKGNSTLFARGNNNKAVVLDSFISDELYIVSIKETSPPVGFQKHYWRGFMNIKGSMISLSVQGQKDKPLSSKEGLATLKNFAKAILDNNNNKDKIIGLTTIDKNEPKPRPVINFDDKILRRTF